MARQHLVAGSTAFVAAMIAPLAPAQASDVVCYDAEVVANIARQTPTDVPECGDCIIMSWPWILELDVHRVQSGRVGRGPIVALSVQHSYYRRDLVGRRWLLRRSTLGVFNVLRVTKDETSGRCPAGTPRARPYIQPEQGETLEDIRREGERRYGREPGA